MRFPTGRHRLALESAVAGYAADPAVRGVAVVGSVPRGDARADSDVDLLLVVTPRFEGGAWRRYHHGVLVEALHRTPEQWRARLARPNPMWVYACLEAEPVHDPDGAVAALRAQAGQVLAGFDPRPRLDELHGVLWWKAVPKMAAALESADPACLGYWAWILLREFLETAWLLNGLPFPSHVMSRLDDLREPPAAAVREVLSAVPPVALARQLELLRAAGLDRPPGGATA